MTKKNSEVRGVRDACNKECYKVWHMTGGNHRTDCAAYVRESVEERMRSLTKDLNQPHGEIFIDENGKPHFQCHNPGVSFDELRTALIKWRDLLTDQLEREEECPVKNNG